MTPGAITNPGVTPLPGTTHAGTIAQPPGFAASYRPTGRDEMLEPDGALRVPWRALVDQLDELGPDEIARRWERGRRLIRENGITHNVYGDPDGLNRPWNLDLIPLLIPSADWRSVADGLAQRARLLDALLADLYGPANCVSNGWLPPELLYANPGFLRPCHGIAIPPGRWLHLYSADFVRLPGGEYRVVSDRTQAPSGAGYCLENRIVISSVLPAPFRQANVHRLAPFFIALRQTLSSLAPSHRDNPRIVLLTPGPYNETYFEHAYLSRYLGYTLVRGNDLTVRDRVVYIKTLNGLHRVDVILRRVDDDYCDPLELLPGSYLGVPGLVEAVRAGNVAVANALGSGMVQAPAFLSYLPVLCQKLLGEELKLPSVQTWWCGDRRSRQYVLENLTRLVIKPAFPTTGSDPQFGADLTRQQLDELAGRIRDKPTEFVAQELVLSRTAPVLSDQKPQARRFVIRGYAVADAVAGTYTVMPGGLTRVTGSSDSLVVSMQRGGGSKDTWILSPVALTEPTLLSSTTQPINPTRGGGELTSRVADDLFWLGRYVQRFEADVRTARCIFTRLADPTRGEQAVTLSRATEALFGRYGVRFDEFRLRDLVLELLQGNGPGGLRQGMADVRTLIRGLRDRVSPDAWRVLHELDFELTEFDLKADTDDLLEKLPRLLNQAVQSLLAFGGVIAESMMREQAWRFMDMGIRVERAITIARLLRTLLVGPLNADAEPTVLDAALEINDSALVYRRRYLTQLQVPAAVDLMVGDENNPRSILYQVQTLEAHLASLPRDGERPLESAADALAALRLRTRLKLTDFAALCRPGPAGRQRLGVLLTGVINSMGEISESVGRIYFSHAVSPRSLAGLVGGASR